MTKFSLQAFENRGAQLKIAVPLLFAEEELALNPGSLCSRRSVVENIDAARWKTWLITHQTT